MKAPMLIAYFIWFGVTVLPAQTANEHRDQAIKGKLAAPPLFLDEEHPGPKMFPENAPKHILPFDCRASQAYLHRTSPGTYHFQRAQYLVGQGPDFHTCDVFGLDRFTETENDVARARQGIKEAKAALTAPIGLGQWRPEAAKYLMQGAYENAAKAYSERASRTGTAEDKKIASEMRNLAKNPFTEVPATLSIDFPKGESGRLFAASQQGNLAEVQALLQRMKPDVRGPASRTPLMLAATYGYTDIAKELISNGADVNAKDGDETTALRIAVVMGFGDIVDLLLANGAHPDDPDEEGTTALMDASACLLPGIAQSLIRAGADVNRKSDDGANSLIAVVDSSLLITVWKTEWAFSKQRDRASLLEMLLKNGADVNSADWKGRTPLMAVAERPDLASLRSLIANDAKLDLRDNKGRTALMIAVEKLMEGVVSELLMAGADPNICSSDLKSPLMIASNHGYSPGDRITLLLIKNGADIHLKDRMGRNALFYAESFVYNEPWGVGARVITAELIKQGLNVNERDSAGNTPLMKAAGTWGHDDDWFLTELTRAGADVNAVNKSGISSLMMAAERGKVTRIKFLLANGARPDPKDKKGRNALDYAADWEDKDDHKPGCIGSTFEDCEGARKVLREALKQIRRKQE
jgi:uncharacterized protein